MKPWLAGVLFLVLLFLRLIVVLVVRVDFGHFLV
jgi:hypothetical protein